MERILIVDDALDLGRLWQTALSTVMPSLNIMVVPSAEEALLEANYHQINLLLTDIYLPGMDGLELVERMRCLHPEVKVILVTGMKDASYEESVKALEADGFFEKPFELEILVEKVIGLLGVESTTRPDLSKLEMEVQEEEPAMEKRLSDVLVSLRQELNALAVILLDEQGKIMELSGDIPMDDFEEAWVPSVLKVMLAGGAVSHLLGKDVPENILAFSGTTFDLMLLAPIGDYSLVSILKSGRTTVRPSLAFEATSVVQPELVKIFKEMGLGTESKQPIDEVELEDVPDEDIQPEEGLENLLAQSPEQDVDTFWETAPDVTIKSDANTLSFDEAMKRGLTPKQDEE
ncbi:MAG: response regulator [Anaerolineaceae bacterium]|nr:response regulator [Anaerolineaceae bacterium]